jgi:hypothetical protein
VSECNAEAEGYGDRDDRLQDRSAGHSVDLTAEPIDSQMLFDLGRVHDWRQLTGPTGAEIAEASPAQAAQTQPIS